MKEWKKIFKKLSATKKIILGFVSLMFLAGMFWLFVNATVVANHEFNRQTVDTVLTYISQQNYEKAYGRFADKYREEEKFEPFKKSVEPFKKLYGNYNENSFTVTKTTRYLLPLDPPTLEYRGEAQFDSGKTKEVKALFIQENGDWRLYLVEVE